MPPASQCLVLSGCWVLAIPRGAQWHLVVVWEFSFECAGSAVPERPPRGHGEVSSGESGAEERKHRDHRPCRPALPWTQASRGSSGHLISPRMLPPTAGSRAHSLAQVGWLSTAQHGALPEAVEKRVGEGNEGVLATTHGPHWAPPHRHGQGPGGPRPPC